MSTFMSVITSFFFFFFNDTATTEIYTLSLHDALPIYALCPHRRFVELPRGSRGRIPPEQSPRRNSEEFGDRKSTRLNSSHVRISYAVFCLKKKKHNYGRQSILTRSTSVSKHTCERNN